MVLGLSKQFVPVNLKCWCFLFLYWLYVNVPSYNMIAVTTSETTISGGYYSDIAKKLHSTVYLDWEFSNIQENGLETFSMIGLQNDFYDNDWMLKPYLLYLTYPLSVGYEDRPSYKSKIQVGRQLLTEGFEIEILDGIYLPYYLSHDLKVWLYGGVVHIPD